MYCIVLMGRLAASDVATMTSFDYNIALTINMKNIRLMSTMWCQGVSHRMY